MVRVCSFCHKTLEAMPLPITYTEPTVATSNLGVDDISSPQRSKRHPQTRPHRVNHPNRHLQFEPEPQTHYSSHNHIDDDDDDEFTALGLHLLFENDEPWFTDYDFDGDGLGHGDDDGDKDSNGRSCVRDVFHNHFDRCVTHALAYYNLGAVWHSVIVSYAQRAAEELQVSPTSSLHPHPHPHPCATSLPRYVPHEVIMLIFVTMSR